LCTASSVLREVFTSFDYKNTGTVEVDELQHAFALYDKYSREEIDEIFAAVVSLFLYHKMFDVTYC
jgi:Ca2+-binding EF-hand superfamily protein